MVGLETLRNYKPKKMSIPNVNSTRFHKPACNKYTFWVTLDLNLEETRVCVPFDQIIIIIIVNTSECLQMLV